MRGNTQLILTHEEEPLLPQGPVRIIKYTLAGQPFQPYVGGAQAVRTSAADVWPGEYIDRRVSKASY
jgi:hypothetical protein